MIGYVIEIRGLFKKFGDLAAVKDLDLTVKPGEIFGFLGPNGAGKTTTVKLITGLLKPTAGTITVCGFDIASQALAAKRLIGLVPDEPFVYPKLTGAEYLRFIGELYGVALDAQKKRIPELLEMFELSDWSGELVESYSHGMRQKLVLCGILLHEPKVLVLDEPMVGLDPKSGRMAKEILLTLKKRGTCIFMCTHILEIAEKLCDRIGIMIRGELVALGTLEELRSKSQNGSSGLEDVFLSLTGGQEYAGLLKHL
ncbi:MAG: ABC transporter ATP-binding protein [Elusimicrobia bacterium]|nr:ABC transporter ATP-binding protein [Elusimicrobiota bacterium]